MRPSSTCRSMPSSATAVPYVLRRPCASIGSMASASFLWSVGCVDRARFQQFFRRETEPPDGRGEPGPLLGQESPALGFEPRGASPGSAEHPEASLLLHELVIDQLLVGLEDRDRVEPVLGGDRAHRGKRIAFVEDPVTVLKAYQELVDHQLVEKKRGLGM